MTAAWIHFLFFFILRKRPRSGHKYVQSSYQITVLRLPNHCAPATKSLCSGYQITVLQLPNHYAPATKSLCSVYQIIILQLPNLHTPATKSTLSNFNSVIDWTIQVRVLQPINLLRVSVTIVIQLSFLGPSQTPSSPSFIFCHLLDKFYSNFLKLLLKNSQQQETACFNPTVVMGTPRGSVFSTFISTQNIYKSQ